VETQARTNDPRSITLQDLERLPSVEERIQFLESCGIPHYVTESNVLSVQIWQAVATLDPKEAAWVRQHQAVPREASALEWVSAHLPELRRKYRGEWIAVADGAIVAHERDLAALMRAVQAAGVHAPFVTQIPEKRPPRYTAYATG
jgi:hypothetical protein